jgi:hypothetical protein
MISENDNKTTVLAPLALMLLSLSVTSLMAIGTPNHASAQGLFEGLEREQSGEGVPGAQPADTGAAALNDTTTVEGGDGATSTTATGNATTTSTTNATTAGQTAGGGNQSTSEGIMHIEQARMALQNNDTQGAMMQLDLALNALGGGGDTQGSMTSNSSGMTGDTPTGGGSTGGEGGGGTATGGAAGPQVRP